MIDTDFIREDSSVSDRVWETYYSELKGINDYRVGGYLRVTLDHGAYDVETRIPYILLESLGWKNSTIDNS